MDPRHYLEIPIHEFLVVETYEKGLAAGMAPDAVRDFMLQTWDWVSHAQAGTLPAGSPVISFLIICEKAFQDLENLRAIGWESAFCGVKRPTYSPS